MTVYDRLKKIITEVLGVAEDDVKPEATFIEDLGADSLDLIELVIAIEEEFHLEISDDDVENLATVQDALNYLEGKDVQ